MKAIQMSDDGLTVEDLPEPVAGADEAVVRISTRRACATPTSTWPGATGWASPGRAVSATRPSASSRPSGRAPSATSQEGQRVILGLGGAGGGYWCGACRYCLGGRPRHCAQNQTVMGVFAEQYGIWAKALVPAARRASTTTRPPSPAEA